MNFELPKILGSEVMSQFGTGKVDFKDVFSKLKRVGFNGPIMVEGVKVGATAEETTANARANREFWRRRWPLAEPVWANESLLVTPGQSPYLENKNANS